MMCGNAAAERSAAASWSDGRMTFIVLATGILATWRVTHLVVEEDGPWDVLRRARSVAETIGAARLVSCFLCTSVWVAVAVALLFVSGWRDVTIAVASFSAGAILLQRALPEPAAEWIEEKEEVP
jgi:hypothetical protein